MRQGYQKESKLQKFTPTSQAYLKQMAQQMNVVLIQMITNELKTSNQLLFLVKDCH